MPIMGKALQIQKNTVSALEEVYIYESSDNLFFCVGKLHSGGYVNTQELHH